MNIIYNQLVPELSVSSFPASLDFYTNILGFSIAYQREEEGFAFLVLENVQIMIDELGKGRDWKTAEFKYPLGRGINLQIEVKAIDSILTRLKKSGVGLFLEVEEKWYRKDDHGGGRSRKDQGARGEGGRHVPGFHGDEIRARCRADEDRRG